MERLILLLKFEVKLLCSSTMLTSHLSYLPPLLSFHILLYVMFSVCEEEDLREQNKTIKLHSYHSIPGKEFRHQHTSYILRKE